MLKLWRRHTPNCAYRDQGRDYTKCRCPIHVDGELAGVRYRKSMATRDMQKASRRLAVMEGPERKAEKPISAAVEAFMASNPELARGTRRNYARTLRFFSEFTTGSGLGTLDEVKLETLDRFRESRPISTLTWCKELEILRGFFRFCNDRQWVADNVARRAKMPKNIKPGPKDPYTSDEVVRILTACEALGQGPYERLRARAMVLLMRYSGLRVSDVATFGRDRIRDGYIRLHTMKNGKPIMLPIPPALQAAFDSLPIPRGSDAKWKYLFWSGNGTKESVIRDVTRTLNSVFTRSGVAGAHAHRFRHTLATEILEKGGTAEDAANILGNSPAVIRKHYAQWTVAHQDRISSLMQLVHVGTFLAQTQTEVSKLLI